MSKAQLVITAVVVEGRSKSEVARDYDVSRTGCSNCHRYEPKGRRRWNRARAAPTTIPRAVEAAVERHIVRLRKTLDQTGLRRRRRHHRRTPRHATATITKVPAV